MPPPRLELTGTVDSRRSLDERSVRPSPPACALPPFGPLCPRSLARQGFSSHRHAVWVSPPPAPEVESRTPRTSDSRSCTGCSSDPCRTPPASPRTHTAPPDWL